MQGSCVTCKHWTQTTDYDGDFNTGICKGGISQKLTIDVHYGWDGGYIVDYETDQDFCCSLYVEKEESQ